MMIENFRRPLHRHPRPIDEMAAAVQKWMPAAEIERENNEWIVIDRGARFSFPSSDTEEGAWENAFTAMQTVNAYYLSGPPDCMDGTPLENWLDAAGNIEDGPQAPLPDPTE
jgi:hypothetical protein